jgi:hypothetical protein
MVFHPKMGKSNQNQVFWGRQRHKARAVLNRYEPGGDGR